MKRVGLKKKKTENCNATKPCDLNRERMKKKRNEGQVGNKEVKSSLKKV